MFKKIIFTILVFFAASIDNAAQSECQHQLTKPFDAKSFQACQQLIKSCITTGPLPDQTCAANQIKQHSICQQSDELASLLDVDVSQLKLTKIVQQFVLVKSTYPADGAETYSIITPKRCVINTVIEPRDIDKSFMPKYKKEDFYTENKGEPTITTNKMNVIFSVPLVMHKQCRACEIIAKPTIVFKFTEQGNLISTRLSR